MYYTIVKHKLTQAFNGLNAGNIQAVLNEFSEHAEHYFIGQHALSGTRHTKASIQQWYQRLFKLFPDIHFDLHTIRIQGMPWNTLAIVDWTEVNSGTDGIRTQNSGVNIMRIRWGKVTSVRIYTDTVILTAALERLAKSGNTYATLLPIVS